MSLYAAWTRLCDDLDNHTEHLRTFCAAEKSIGASTDFTRRDEYLLEGILSRVWQAWCHFCRTCVVESCVGTVDGTGASVAALPHAPSAAHVSGAAIRAKRATVPPYWGSTNSILRHEPTWGDADVLTTIIPRLQPCNQVQLMAAFSHSHSAAKALQLIRNATAHDNTETRMDLQVLWSRYVIFPITHPTHCLYWVEPSTNDYLVFRAIDDLRDGGLAAIS